MKNAIYTFSSLLISLHLSAQSNTFQWAKGFGGSQDDYSTSITTDTQSNAYLAGTFEGTVDFNPGSGTNTQTSSGQQDAFLSKFDVSGNHVWTRKIGGTGSDAALSVHHSNNNIYVAGYFTNTVNFNPAGTAVNLTATGTRDAFAAKYDLNGNLVWVKQFGQAGIATAYSITVDNSGNVYTSGYFNTSIDLNPGAGTLIKTSAGLYDLFISKLNSAGDFVWGLSIGGTGEDVVKSVVTDENNNLFLTGSFSGTVNFNPSGTTNLSSAGSKDIFLLKLDGTGSYAWAKRYGGSGTEEARSIALDTDENVYITGFYNSSSINFSSNTLTGMGVTDGFLLKTSPSGTENWARSFGGAGSDFSSTVAIDSDNIIYVGGAFTQTANFDVQGSGANLTSMDGSDGFFTAFNAAGNFLFVEHLGADEAEVVNAITVSAQDEVYVLGDYNSSIIFNTSSGNVTLQGNGSTDIFVARYAACSPTTGSISQTACGSYTWTAGTGETYTLSTTVSHTYTSSTGCDSIVTLNLTINNVNTATSVNGITLTANQSGAVYQWVDCDNGDSPISGATTQSFTPTTNGNYAVRVTFNNCTETSDCIIVNSVGIESVEQDDWSIYPNPSNGIFMVSSSFELNDHVIEVYSALGELVYSTRFSGKELLIDLRDQPTGIYTVRVDKQLHFRIVTF